MDGWFSQSSDFNFGIIQQRGDVEQYLNVSQRCLSGKSDDNKLPTWFDYCKYHVKVTHVWCVQSFFISEFPLWKIGLQNMMRIEGFIIFIFGKRVLYSTPLCFISLFVHFVNYLLIYYIFRLFVCLFHLFY